VPVSLAHPDEGSARVPDRTFRILGALRELGEGAHALRTIVDRAGLSRSTVQRHMSAGLRSGFIRQPRHGYYTLARPTMRNPISETDVKRGHTQLRGSSPGRARELLSGELRFTARLHAAVLTDIHPAMRPRTGGSPPRTVPTARSSPTPPRTGEQGSRSAY
jgi:hypothetical protein